LRFFKRPTFDDSAWYFSLIPINMAIGSIRIVIVLIALAAGAGLFEIGLLVAFNSASTIVFALFWGRISDFFGLRKRFMLFLFLLSGPVYVLIGLSNSVLSLTVLYTVLAAFTGGIQPIASMYAVEYREGKNWQREVVRFNSYLNIGVILGLVINTLLALVIPLSWILYLAAALCLVSAVVLWKTAKEPMLPLEREAYAFGEYFDLRKLKRLLSLKKPKPITIMFIICLIHWTGVYAYGVGEVPLMSAIGLSSSMILGINVAENAATVYSFNRLVPRVKMSQKKLITTMMITRGTLIMLWAGLTFFIVNQFSGVFILPLILEIAFLLCYALVWYTIMCFAISQSPPGRKGTTQGELLSVISLANVAGALVGGLIIGVFGFALGFIVSGIIAILAIPLLRYIDIEINE
jgi:MFS family permease